MKFIKQEIDFTKQEIKEAIDIVIGDGGLKSDEVIKILEMWAKNETIVIDDIGQIYNPEKRGTKWAKNLIAN